MVGCEICLSDQMVPSEGVWSPGQVGKRSGVRGQEGMWLLGPGNRCGSRWRCPQAGWWWSGGCALDKTRSSQAVDTEGLMGLS
jgi:hypothetical protein